MKILCIGDVVSREGVDFLSEKLPRIKREYKSDIVIVNGENSAVGNGIDKASYEAIMSAGADIVTGGNHSFQKKSADILHDEEKRLLRPGNLPLSGGRGIITLDSGRTSLRVINLSGALFMSECENPFEYIDSVLNDNAKIPTVVDFHAEATSEKRAMGFYLDGRVSLVFGTHTHVATADAQILPNGTGYITDIGMTGVKNSVIGKDADTCIHNFRLPEQRLPVRDAVGGCMLSGIIADIDAQTCKCLSVDIINIDN